MTQRYLHKAAREAATALIQTWKKRSLRCFASTRSLESQSTSCKTLLRSARLTSSWDVPLCSLKETGMFPSRILGARIIQRTSKSRLMCKRHHQRAPCNAPVSNQLTSKFQGTKRS